MKATWLFNKTSMWIAPHCRAGLELVALLAGLFCGLLAIEATAAEKVRIGTGHAVPPFVIPLENSGLTVDVVRSAFASQSLHAEFAYMSDARAWQAFAEGWVDVIINAKPEGKHKGVLSRWPVFTFRNQAITLRQKIPHIRSITDLGRYRVVTFLDAREAKIDQRVLDGFEYHGVFKGNQYWMAFRTSALRETFEKGIAVIYGNGQIDAIFDRYRAQYGTSREMFIELDCRFLKNNRPQDCQ